MGTQTKFSAEVRERAVPQTRCTSNLKPPRASRSLEAPREQISAILSFLGIQREIDVRIVTAFLTISDRLRGVGLSDKSTVLN